MDEPLPDTAYVFYETAEVKLAREQRHCLEAKRSTAWCQAEAAKAQARALAAEQREQRAFEFAEERVGEVSGALLRLEEQLAASAAEQASALREYAATKRLAQERLDRETAHHEQVGAECCAEARARLRALEERLAAVRAETQAQLTDQATQLSAFTAAAVEERRLEDERAAELVADAQRDAQQTAKTAELRAHHALSEAAALVELVRASCEERVADAETRLHSLDDSSKTFCAQIEELTAEPIRLAEQQAAKAKADALAWIERSRELTAQRIAQAESAEQSSQKQIGEANARACKLVFEATTMSSIAAKAAIMERACAQRL